MARTVDPVQHRARRRQILDGAAGLFARHGYERTTTAQICRGAAISPGNLYHYFRSKKEIFLAVLTEDPLPVPGPVEQEPLAALLDMVDRLAAPAAHPIVPSLVLEAMLQAHRDPEVAEVLERADGDERAALTKLLRAAVAADEVDPTLDVDEAAAWLNALVGAVYLEGATSSSFDPARQLANLRRTARAYLTARESD